MYYGSWNASQVDYARRNYRLVVVDAHNISASQIASIKSGPDNAADTADDVYVLSYISVSEDTRPGGPFVGDGLGPRVDPRSSDAEPLSSITNALGAPSPGGTGYASYYLDTKSSPDGIPDRNSNYGGYYINAGAPAWWPLFKGMTITANGNAGLDELLSTNVGKGLNCDGLFLDTIDTCAPNSFGGTTYEWTTPGMQGLIQRIGTNYPTKLLMANRGLFFYNPNYKHYAYTIRPYLHLVMFESYLTDSSNSGQITPYFSDNKYNWAPKLNAEAGRPDGFNVVALGYDHTPPLPQSIIDQDYRECMGVQGWPLYRTDPSLTSTFTTNAVLWLATNADTQPPIWDSTAAQSATPPTPRVGIQEAFPANQSVIVRWDVARDQTQPVRYNIYYTGEPTMTFDSAIKLSHVTPAIPAAYTNGAGAGIYPYEYTITGLSNGVSYLFAVRAEDSASPVHEDTTTVTLIATPGPVGAAGNYRAVNIDGDFSDWAGIPWAFSGAPNGNPVNFARVQFANDANYLYGHFVLFSDAAPFADSNTHLFVDGDNNRHTGFQVASAAFGSEWMVEGSAGYDQRNGGFNEGTISGLAWAKSPMGSGAEFEFRVSRSVTFADGAPMLSTNAFRLLLQDNRGSEAATGNGILYVLAVPPPPTYRHITVDGNFSDWKDVPILATAASNSSPITFATASVANDNVYLYLLFTLHASGAPFSDFNTHVFIDTDANYATGYRPAGVSAGSELVVESGLGYDERSGVFAGTKIDGLDWVQAPAGPDTNFELRISRLARYADNSLVFTNPTIRIVLQDNCGSVLTPQGITYTFAQGGPYEDWRALYFTPAELSNPAISGDAADASGDGIANLVKYAFDLNPRLKNRPSLPAGFIAGDGGTDFFHFEFVQRNPPADVQYVPQISSDLITWDGTATNFATVNVAASSNNTSIATMRLQTPQSATPRSFVRIAIQK